MKIKRLDIFDFQVVLTEQEFNKIKAAADADGDTVEEVLYDIVQAGFENDFYT